MRAAGWCQWPLAVPGPATLMEDSSQRSCRHTAGKDEQGIDPEHSGSLSVAYATRIWQRLMAQSPNEVPLWLMSCKVLLNS